ncbi:E3 ubiquitin-protein ligase RAD18 [Neosynchiropus ocellatus]
MPPEIEADLPPTLACLKPIDSALRCPICFEFLNIAMITKCSHNFCSLCIRRFLSYKLQCPVCNTPATEQDLRNNRLLDDLVAQFQAARQQLSKANLESPPMSPKTPALLVKCRTPRSKVQKCNSPALSQFFQKRIKASPVKETQTGEIDSAHTSESLRSGTVEEPVKVKQEPDEAEQSSSGAVSVKQEKASLFNSNLDEPVPTSTPCNDSANLIIKVECPVCSVSLSPRFINKHLDVCLASGEKKDSLRSSVGKTRQPMGKLVYTLLSTCELKRKLRQCHLSVQGSRDQMIKKHKEFVHFYNAECDALNPKSAEEIAKEIEANEKIRNRLQGKTKPVLKPSKNQSEKEIEEWHSNYRKQHSSDFSRLVAQVRGRLDSAKQTVIKPEAIERRVDVPETQSADVAESIGWPPVEMEDQEVKVVPSASGNGLPASPASSDISVSSSISDIFGPDPSVHSVTDQTVGQKRAFNTRGAKATVPPTRGKRKRKT